MAEERSKEALEIYKLHAELADRVSQRRLGTSRIYISVLVGLLLFLGGLLKFGEIDRQDGLLLCLVGVMGALFAVSWDRVIRAYEQLNTGKFQALRELEGKLVYQFFEREWHFLGQGEDASKYMKLSKVERSGPWLFFALYMVVLVLGIAQMGTYP